MPWTAPTATTTGELYTAARYNTDVVDNLNLLKTPIANDGKLASTDGVLTTPEIKGFKETVVALTISSNVLTVDMAAGTYFRFTLNANITTMTINNIPASGKLGSFVLEVTADGTGRTWTWQSATVKWPSDIAPTVTITNNKVDRFLFMTRDGGTTWVGSSIGQNYAA